MCIATKQEFIDYFHSTFKGDVDVIIKKRAVCFSPITEERKKDKFIECGLLEWKTANYNESLLAPTELGYALLEYSVF